MAEDLDYETLVECYYEPLYRFALSLAGSEADACDLTQQTFYIAQTKGYQLRSADKIKSWLFTTMHHEFLNSRRRFIRFPHCALEQAEDELPPVFAEGTHTLDAQTAVAALGRVDQPHQAAVALFYLEDYSYKEIASILNIPIGTVKSRLARGIAQLQQLLTPPIAASQGKVAI
jgi:RNA polymerase sigma-70 factor, ECF subfamily